MTRPRSVLGARRAVVLALAAVVLTAGCSSAPGPTMAVLPASTAGPVGAPAGQSPVPASAPIPTLVGDPNPVLTPGATNPAVTEATKASTICRAGWTATIRPPSSFTTKLKVSQIAAYGYADHSTATYEEDHLISLEIGGAPQDPANLWPEFWSLTSADGTQVGARTKDRFENYLNNAVCAGMMSLADAQDAIAHDWVGHWLADGRP